MKIDDLYNNQTLENEARLVQFDNVNAGEEGHHPPEDATWRYATVPMSKFIHLMGNVDEWKSWYKDEIDAHENDGNESIASFYRNLVKNPIDEEPIVFNDDGTFYIWDGYHRIGAGFVRGDDSVKVVLGEPK